MPLKEQVLAALYAAQGQYLSGQALAEQLQVSRSAVWKAITGLRQEGFPIASVTNRGYRLESGSDPLTEEAVRAGLDPDCRELRVLVYPEVDSTNNEAKRLLAQGETRPLLLTADRQTQGRGRQGRAFFSPGGTGLYMTLVLHPHAELAGALSVTTMASVAVARAIRRLTGQTPGIKWVNDLYLDGKKICGILTEAVTDVETATVQSLVIGIGVNIRTRDFPPELAGIGGALQREALSRARLAAEIANQLLPMVRDLADRSYLEDYRRWSLVLGREVQVLIQGQAYPALALAIDDRGGLVVRKPDGEELTLSSGEISLRLV